MVKCCGCKYWESENGIKGICEIGELVIKRGIFGYSYWDDVTTSLGTDWSFECKYGKNEKVKSV